MPQKRSNYQFFQEASLSQKLSDKDPIFKEISGCDPVSAKSIGFFIVLGLHGYVDMNLEKAKEGIFEFNDPNIAVLFDMQRMNLKISFATSEKTNEITKMGLRMPKAEDIITDFNEE